jgi:CubicO group peptidase (beta-lactamase class C family)
VGQGGVAIEIMGRLKLAVALLSLVAEVALAQAFPIDDVDKWIEGLHKAHGFSGAVVVMRDGNVLYSRGIGVANADTARAFTPDTPTDGGSLAKPFTAASLLMLVEDGSIDLQAPVKRYVSEYPDATTTVYDLVSHRAPLPDYDAFRSLIKEGKPVTTLALLNESTKVAAASAAPSPAFTYCNVCLDATALVIERVTAKRFDAVLRQQMFFYLGIDNAFIRPARLASLTADRAVGYRMKDGRRERFDAEDLEGFYGGSNLYASARNFARFANAYVVPPSQAGKRFALSPRTTWPLLPAGGLSYGLTLGNWYCANGGERCYYPGVHRGFYNAMYWDRAKRITVVHVSNAALPAWLQPRVTRELVAAAEGRSVAQLSEPKLIALTPDALKSAGGIYDVPGAGRITLMNVDDKPYLRSDIGFHYRLYPVSATMLYAPGLDAYIGIGEDKRLSWTTVFLESFGIRVAS